MLNFRNFQRENFLNSRYEYENEWVDEVIASQFSIKFVHRNDENLIFQLWEIKLALKPLCIII